MGTACVSVGMNISLTDSRDHADDLQKTTGRQAPLRASVLRLAGVGLSVAALAVAGTAVWQSQQGPDQATSVDDVVTVAAAPQDAGSEKRRAKVHSKKVHEAALAPVELGSQSGDIDGDGRTDVVRLMATDGSSAPDQIEIFWGTEGSETHALTGGGEGEMYPFRDLDGDGDLEIVVGAGGGESGWFDVFTFTGTDVVQAKVAGAPASEVSSLNLYQSPDWLTTYADGFVEYRFVDEADTTVPAAVEVRDWVLDGTTFTQSPSAAGCWVKQGESFGLERGAC